MPLQLGTSRTTVMMQEQPIVLERLAPALGRFIFSGMIVLEWLGPAITGRLSPMNMCTESPHQKKLDVDERRTH